MHFREDDADKVIADENIALRGLVELLSSDKEADIRRKLSAVIQTRFPLCEGRDFILLPRFFEGDMLKLTFKNHPAANECIKKFRRGVQKLGLMTIIENFQQFLFLLQPSNSTF